MKAEDLKTGTGFCPVFSYNTMIKVSGREVTVKRYKKPQIRGYVNSRKMNAGHENNQLFEWIIENNAPCKCLVMERYEKIALKNAGVVDEFEVAEDLEQKRLRFIKSVNRARENIFDVIGCNAGEWKTPTGVREKIKFVTLTFRDDIRDIKVANYEFVLFIKRLNDWIFNTKKAVLKYICIPELQKRGVWHYHVVFFNLPPIPQGEKVALEWIEKGRWDIKDKNLTNIWGNGFVGINVINNASRAASYVVKYLSKGIDVDANGNVKYKSEGADDGLKRLGDYDLYSSLGLENMKRYQCSRGMKRPIKRYLALDKQQHKEMFDNFKAAKALLPLDKNGTRVKKHAYDNKHRGEILMFNLRINKNYVSKYVAWLNEKEEQQRHRRFLKIEGKKENKYYDYKQRNEQKYAQNVERREWVRKSNELLNKNVAVAWFHPVHDHYPVEEIEQLFA